MKNKRIFTIVLTFVCVLFIGQATAFAASHLVSPGESLWIVSTRYGTTVNEVASLNRISNPTYVEAGQRLAIPGKGQLHRVVPGESLWIIANKYGTSPEELGRLNGISNLSYIESGQDVIVPSSNSGGGSAPQPNPPSSNNWNLSASDLDLFARLVYSEAAGEPYRGQVAVAASVLNRVKSPLYPNTVRRVIYQVTNGYYQYSPVLDGRINLPANESARRAVRDALNGSDPSGGATGFYNPRKTSNVWVRQQPVSTVIANHVFFF